MNTLTLHDFNCDYYFGDDCTCGADTKYITLATSDTSEESFKEALELYRYSKKELSAQ